MNHQSLLPVSEEDRPVLTLIRLPLKRKRAQDDVTQNGDRCPDSSSPERKKRRICYEKSSLKRPYSQISTDKQSVSETYSPERKRMRMTEEMQISTEEKESPKSWLKRPYSQISRDSQSVSETYSPERKRMRMTEDTDQKASAVTPSIPEDASSAIVQLIAQIRRDTASSSQSDARSSESALTETKRKEEHKVANIWIIGSSYIKRGERGAREKFGENLGLNARVQWFGKGGMRWNGVLPRFYAELSTRSPPDILVIHAGGNDLGLTSAQELSCVMKKELKQLHAEFPSMNIVFSCINERQVWRYGRPGWINLDRKRVNSSMAKAADRFGGVVVEHPRLRYFDKTIFVPDGVHFTKRGNELFVTNIRSAIKNILQSSQTK